MTSLVKRLITHTPVLCLSLIVCGVLLWQTDAHAAVDPNFHVYLCFGQSNMEGNAQWESVDNQYVDPRFQMLATCDFSSPSRTTGVWYTAYCPIVNTVGKLGLCDYFGRTMVAAMPSNVKIGVVAVAMGGSPIEMFDKDKYQKKINDNPSEWWAQIATNCYGGNPYGRLVAMAKKAQEVGVIKGILLHQGCSNNGDPAWPAEVHKIYNDLLSDLGLQASEVPIFVGETKRADMGGICSGHNAVVAQIPTEIPTGHIVSSEDIPGADQFHFSAAGYRTFGKRYAREVLRVMGMELRKNATYSLPANLQNFYALTTLEDCEDVVLKVGSKYRIKLYGTFADGHRENLSDEVVFSSSDFQIVDGKVIAEEEKTGTVTATYTSFTGQEYTKTIRVQVTGNGLGRKLEGLDALQGPSFVIVNDEEGKAFYGSSMQHLQYDELEKALLDTNTGYQFKLENCTVAGCSLLRLIQPDGTPYDVYGGPGYLNSQPETGWCSFILGLNNQNGQDVENGAAWTISYEEGKGFSLLNKATGLYLKDASPAKYATPTWFSFYTNEGTAGIENVNVNGNVNDNGKVVYTLQGLPVGCTGQLPAGIYIRNGKKIVIKR